jgi:regulator of protease activity HflC (stomatin/prohibitin superfamily)
MLLTNRKAADEELRQTIYGKTANWGIDVRSVEIRDVRIPSALQNAMSRQAQAERERQARVILGTAEAEIAQKFVEAARTYADNPVALHLRGMNMLYESVKERGSTIIVPSSAVDSMNLGSISGITSLAKARGNRRIAALRVPGRPPRPRHANPCLTGCPSAAPRARSSPGTIQGTAY